MGRGWRVVIDQRRAKGLLGRAVATAEAELLRGQAPAQVTDHGSTDDDQRERQFEGKNRHEGRPGNRP